MEVKFVIETILGKIRHFDRLLKSAGDRPVQEAKGAMATAFVPGQ